MMAFKYYEKYLAPEGAPEMPEDKRGEEQINKISEQEQQGKCAFINLAVLTLTLVFCAMIVFVLRANDYSSLNESTKLEKDNFLSGEYFGGLESDVISHLALSDEIVRTDNFLHYFCGIGNTFMEREEEEDISTQGNAFRTAESPVPGGRNNDGELHEVMIRTTTASSDEPAKETKKTKNTKKTKAKETSVTTAVKQMTSTEPEHPTTTTTTTTEATTTTVATNNKAPNVTTKVTTASTAAPPPTETTKKTTKATTKQTTAETTKETTESTTESSADTQTEPSSSEENTEPPPQPEEGQQ
ncbi:MAG: hypothetical protein J6O40_02665 [Ruminococcus sp.]|nr:hypothetical protein [Ruminococcus sp.]